MTKLSTVATSVLAVGLAFSLPMASCGGDNDPPANQMPDDFAVAIGYVAGSVPPPHHDEWTLEIAEDGSATYAYTPDYAGEGVPTWTEEFELDDSERTDIYEELRDAGLLESIDSGGEGLAGGDFLTATITADGETYEVPAYGTDDEPVIDDATQETIEDIVPADIRDSIEAKADRYAEREYGETP